MDWVQGECIMCLRVIYVYRYRIDKTSNGRLVDDQLIDGLHNVQYNGRCHSQVLPQYFVLDKDAVDAAT